MRYASHSNRWWSTTEFDAPKISPFIARIRSGEDDNVVLPGCSEAGVVAVHSLSDRRRANAMTTADGEQHMPEW